jgi:O-antigen/teichoic acid export membrane protein
MSQSFSSATIAKTLTRNTLLNLLSQGVYLALAFWGIPILIQGLGPEQFGLLALVWAVVGYFTLLDFGISRANTKFISEVLVTKDRDQEHKIIWSSLFSTMFVGLLSGLLIFLCAPYAVDQVLNINAELRTEAIEIFKLTALGVPFMLLYGTLKGFQMAVQRFDQINYFQIGIGIVQWCGSILLVGAGYSTYSIVVLTIVSRIFFTIAVAVTMPWIYHGFYSRIQPADGETLKKLWSFGGWVFISQVISPLYLYIDRIFIGMFLTLHAVSFYSVPQEALSRLLVLTMSFTVTLFPAMSAQAAVEEHNGMARLLYFRSMKYLLIVSVPAALCFILFAKEIVGLWLGADFAAQTYVIFQVLTVGLVFNSVAQIPNTILHAYNRPDIPAKFHVLEFPLVIALNIVLIPIIGIIGAAIAWSTRVFVDSVLHMWAVERGIRTLSLGEKLNQQVIAAMIVVASMVVSTGLIMTLPQLAVRIAAMMVTVTVYYIATWRFGLDELEKNQIHQLYHRVIH